MGVGLTFDPTDGDKVAEVGHHSLPPATACERMPIEEVNNSPLQIALRQADASYLLRIRPLLSYILVGIFMTQ
jgi:hypothetical protein